MKWFFWLIRIVPVLLLGVLLAYYLPTHDIVHIAGTDVKRMDVDNKHPGWDQPDAGTRKDVTRDVRFIYAEWPDGRPRVYRNEDTGWSFPFYFKFDSADLAAKAEALAKREDNPYVVVTKYGWRLKVLSLYPNAVKLREVEGPNALIIPWFNIIFLSLLAVGLLYVWLAWRRFKKKRIAPVIDKVEDVAQDIKEEVADEISDTKGWLQKLFKRSKPPEP